MNRFIRLFLTLLLAVGFAHAQPPNYPPPQPAPAVRGTIPDGYRAATVQLKVGQTLKGMKELPPKVQIIFTSHLKGREGTTTLVPVARVLSSEPSSTEGEAFVTFLITKQEAEKMSLASVSGDLRIEVVGDR